MIARAKKAFPGVVVTLMLAAPTLAATPGSAQAQPRRSSEPAEHRKVGGKSGALKSTKTVASQASRARNSQMAQHRRRGSFRYEAAEQTAFVDDGGSYDPDTVASGSHVRTWQQSGLASWYGGSWNGRSTTSGSHYDQEALTAAHASLPMGTKVRVVLNDSARSVVVTINDRPGTRTRIIDLSRAAARELGILDRGVAMVTLAPL